MRGKRKRISLTLELVLMTVAALLCGVLFGGMVSNIGYDLVIDYWEQRGYYEKINEEKLQSLRNFIETYQITEENVSYLYSWVQKEPDIYAMFYKDIDVLYSPYVSYEGEPEELDYYEVLLADGTPIKVELYCGISMKVYYGIEAAGYVAGAAVFILVLLALIHHRLKYIHELERELKILSGGNLEYPITIRGRDEITELAESISALKNGILEEQKMKDEAERANKELVTAMSHDLRTPLTSLIGYLELLHMHRYRDEAQLEDYLEHCRNKAFQLKKMSDRLFEYFLVYGKQEEVYQFQSLPCMELIEYFCNGQFYDWQDQGGQIDCRIEDIPGMVRVDSSYLQRVADNITSNLKKYGDTSHPLEITVFARQDMLHILLTNKVREQKQRVESTQIGLKTCRRIMEKHGGSFIWEQRADEFCETMIFPITR